MTLKPVKHTSVAMCQRKGCLPLFLMQLSLCHRFNSLMQVQNFALILMEGGFLCSFVRYHASKTFYHFLSFTSSTDNLLCGFASSLILSVQTCLYHVSHVPSGT